MANKYADSEGNPVKGKAAVVKAYREMTEGLNSHTIAFLDDDTVWKTVSSIEGEGDAVDAERCNALEAADTAAEKAAPDPVTPANKTALSIVKDNGDGSKYTSTKIAELINGSLDEIFRRSAQAEKDKAQAGLKCALVLMERVDRAHILAAPKPGSISTKDKPINNPDRYRKQVRDTETGKLKSIQAAYYADSFDLTPQGSEWSELLGRYKKAKSPDGDAVFSKMRKEDRMHDTSAVQRDYNAALKAYRQGWKIGQQWCEIEKETAVVVKVIQEVDKQGNIVPGSVKNTTYPIGIADKAQPMVVEWLSVTQFLALKPDKAEGKSVESLKDTLKKDAGKTTVTAAPILDMRQGEEAFTNLALALTNDNFSAVLNRRLQGPDATALLLTIKMVHAETGLLVGPGGKYETQVKNAEVAQRKAAHDAAVAKAKALAEKEGEKVA